MLVTVNEREFVRLVKCKEDIVNARVDYSGPFMASISARWIAVIPPSALQILIYLAGRTVAFGKAAVRLSYKEFLEDSSDPSDSVCFAPLNIGIITLQKHLKWLTDHDFLIAYSVRRLSSGADNQSKMFEINFKKMIDAPELEHRNRRLLAEFHAQIEGRIEAEKAEKSTQNRAVAPQSWRGGIHRFYGGPSYNIHIFPSGIKESINENPPVSDAAVKVGDSQVLAEPKKPRVKVQRADSISAVVETVSTTHRKIAEVRADAAATGALTKANVQAMIDKYMAKWNPGLPRVLVTDKPMGPFKKRLREANVNIPDFLEYMVREWRALAVQNHVSRRRAMGQNVKGDALPDAPDFKVMSYRMPYFLACYSNYLARGTKPEQEDAKDKMIESLKHRVDALQQEKVVIGEVLRRKKLNSSATTTGRIPGAAPAPSTVPKRPAPTIDAGDSIINDDWEPPEWQEKKSGWGSK